MPAPCDAGPACPGWRPVGRLSVGRPPGRVLRPGAEEPPRNRLSLTRLGLPALALVLVLAVAAVADETKGKIKGVDPARNEFVLTDVNARDWPVQLDRNARVFLNDQEAKLTDLRAGDEVSVTSERQGDQLLTRTIRASRK